MAPRLTPTSYVVLGLLARRPWTPYELEQELRWSAVPFLIGRSRSKIYAEPKRLEDLGLVRSREERNGAQTRTRYSINAAGRRALREWLAEPGGSMALAYEAALKIVFADSGSKADLVATLRQIGEHRGRAVAIEMIESYLEEGPRVPERIHTIALTNRLLAEISAAFDRWAEWAEEWVETWPDLEVSERVSGEALDSLRENLTLFGDVDVAAGRRATAS